MVYAWSDPYLLSKGLMKIGQTNRKTKTRIKEDSSVHGFNHEKCIILWEYEYFHEDSVIFKALNEYNIKRYNNKEYYGLTEIFEIDLDYLFHIMKESFGLICKPKRAVYLHKKEFINLDGCLCRYYEPYDGIYNDLHYTNGKPSNNSKYIDGKLKQGLIDSIFYNKGELYTGFSSKNRLYKTGKIYTGLYNKDKNKFSDGVLYQDGEILIGVYGSKLYQDGKLKQGYNSFDKILYKDGELFNGKYNNKQYLDGKFSFIYTYIFCILLKNILI